DTVQLWHKISTVEDAEWTKRYHETDPAKKAFGAKVEIFFKDGTKLVDEMAMANAHPLGAKPFKRPDYIRKFQILTEEILAPAESKRFLELVQNLPDLNAKQLLELNVQVPPPKLTHAARDRRG